MPGELTPQRPEQDRPLQQSEDVLGEIDDAKRETRRLRYQTALPMVKAVKDEIIRRAQDGTLSKELQGRKIASLIRDLKELVQVLNDNVPSTVVITPPAPASEGKDYTHFRAKSVVRLTDKDRAALRKQVINGELDKENPDK